MWSGPDVATPSPPTRIACKADWREVHPPTRYFKRFDATFGMLPPLLPGEEINANKRRETGANGTSVLRRYRVGITSVPLWAALIARTPCGDRVSIH